MTFTGEFYGSLSDGLPVDQAVTSARKALLSGYQAEWATPVLFLRSKDGQVFENIVAAPVETQVPPVVPTAPITAPTRATQPMPVRGPPPTVPTQVVTRRPDLEPTWQQAPAMSLFRLAERTGPLWA